LGGIDSEVDCLITGLGDDCKLGFDNIRVILKPAVAAIKAILMLTIPFDTPAFLPVFATFGGVAIGRGVAFLRKFLDFKSDKLIKANLFLKNISNNLLNQNSLMMEKQIKKYFPNFHDYFEHEGHQVSMKTKIKGVNDPRDCRIIKKGNVISIFSGKIDTLYIAEEFILNVLK
jgi:hypothetical protein